MRPFVLGIGAVVVVAGVLVSLSFMTSPKPSSADSVIGISRTAESSFNTKWNRFNAALKGGGQQASLTLTSVGARYLDEQRMLAKNLQVHLCAGRGKGQASLSVQGLGRDLEVVVTGHLDLDKEPPQIVVDSLQMGLVPEQLTTWLANRIVGLATINVPSGIGEVTSTSTAVTLKGR